MTDLLIELFSEEIPARMQDRAANDLKKLVTDGIVEAGLTYASAAAFSTPRRLTLTVDGMLDSSPLTVEERKGPKADAPEKAIEGFLRGAGVNRDELYERETPKGNVFFAKITKEGRPAADIVAEVLERTIRNFPWPKSMRWGSGTLKWVRPLHSIICIISSEEGANIVPVEVDGITSGNTTCGHRFLSPDEIIVNNFDDYIRKLKLGHVVLDAQERADAIWNDATNQAFATGFEVVKDAGLLAEVAGLVEWPVVLMGEIGEEFLGLPAEVLQTSMREHQKFFSVRNTKTGRIERFITVANRTTADSGATILAGNQKVLSARLADAKFFWENDLRIAQSDMNIWLNSLENVTFHNKLGTQAELVNRMASLARELAPAVGADCDMAEKAARLAKADLSSEMVYEFPELQGLMGRYYVEASGEDAQIAAAAEEHYAPLGPSDDVPTAPVSIAVSLAEKLEKLNGFWSIDEKPTGSKDPFALRRAALGIIRIIIENDLVMPLNTTMPTEHADSLLSFFHDRLKVYLKDQGIRHDIIDACIVMDGNDDINLLVKRARALSEALKTDDGENLIQGFKRANNILFQAEAADGVEYSYGADVKFAQTDEERSLFAALDASEAKIKKAIEAQDFAIAMSAMAMLRAPIDAFFEAVQINAENPTVRRNRLNLLSRIRTVCSPVADLTKIEG
jgi:glycyl-tRNA synthetase beta chain